MTYLVCTNLMASVELVMIGLVLVIWVVRWMVQSIKEPPNEQPSSEALRGVLFLLVVGVLELSTGIVGLMAHLIYRYYHQ